ncbi:MAG: hypothetical protein K8T26_13245 [Lentisphaerae bacterium]|nr:hypothetical protein [Lentisphaerota bacterium]
MTSTAAQLARDNHRLRSLIEAPGRRVDDFWPIPEPDPRIENARLQDLLVWVRAFTAEPDRKRLEAHGFLYPPVDPGFDPDSDWLQFTRWMAGRPLSWHFVTEFGPLPPEDGLSDVDIARELKRIGELLESRHVVIDLQENLPERIAYRCLKRELEGEPFEYVADGTTCHVTACSGYCPGCLQRPWCESGLESAWPEDEESGHLTCPEEVAAHMPATAVRAGDGE